MSANELDVLGPVDYLVVEFPADKANFTGEIAAELGSLIEGGTVRVLDLVILRKDEDESLAGALLELEGELALLLATQDLEAIGEAIEPGTVAAVLVWENSWAGPFGAAVRRAGGQLVANGRINTQALLAAAETEEGA